jgi:hypothetical protein
MVCGFNLRTYATSADDARGRLTSACCRGPECGGPPPGYVWAGRRSRRRPPQQKRDPLGALDF